MLKWISSLVLIAACGFPRPADVLDPRSCADGICTDPAYPFCDEGGEVTGAAQTCVAVSCAPGDFAACRGDTELSCNSAGTTYDSIQCARGCDPVIGCRLCEPNQTVCSNGKVQTCDATGAVTSSEACPLGCFEDQPRCREIDPSNGLAAYMAMAATGPDLVLDNATLFVPLGRVIGPKGQIDLRSQMVAATPGGAAIQVFPVRSLTVIGIVSLQQDSPHTNGVPAVALVVYGDVKIDGTLRLEASAGGDAPPGAITSGDCVGAVGHFDVAGVGYFAGSGGGGNATQGGAGGGQYFPASPGGAASPNPDLQPLRGGCSGGTPTGFTPGNGGGAIQITSRSSIQLRANSTIEANGSVGFAGVIEELPGSESIPGGGGSGGGILLEAPTIALDAGVALVANGGAGTSGDWHQGIPASGRTPSIGGSCTLAADICTSGGDGGSVYGPGGTAASIPFQGQQQLNTGGGGGSVGNIRINTWSGVYTKANDVFESPIPSTGSISTR